MAARIDWDAIKRDYRTDQFTDRELGAKHKVAYETIIRRRKKDREKDPNDWPKDLTEAVRQATNSLLMQEMVTNKITEGQQNVTTTVLAAAEVNKQVIKRHRSDLDRARSVTMDLVEELRNAAMFPEHFEMLASILAGEGAEPRDVNEARKVVARALGLGSRVSSAKALADAITKLHAAEREAFGITNSEAPPDPLGALLSQVSRSALPIAKSVPEEDDDA